MKKEQAMTYVRVEKLEKPGQCHKCGTSLGRNLPAYLNEDTGEIWCEACGLEENLVAESGSPAVTQLPAGADEPAQLPMSAEAMQNLWNRFYTYQASCLKADLVDGMQLVNGKRWICLPETYESVVAQGDRLLPISAELDRLVSRMLSSQGLQYGWPTVVLETRSGLKVAPLLVVDLAPPPYTGHSVAVYADPVINPAVIRALWTKSGDIDFLRSQVGHGLPTTAVAMARFAQRICGILGLECGELDPYNLDRDIKRAPGVYNCSVAVVVESMSTARPIIEELRQCAGRDDWHNTASSILFGLQCPDVSGRTNTPVMPWSTEQSFEDAVQMVRHYWLNVFDMAQRDVVDQLLTTICANAWMDEESVLIVSDDERKLDELARVGSDVHLGMLVRTTCSADLEANPTRECTPISDVASSIIEELGAAKDSLVGILERVAKEVAEVEKKRRIALDGAERRASLLAEKQMHETKRVELAKRIWPSGAHPAGIDPISAGQEAKALLRSWLFAGFRTKSFLRGIKAKDSASLQSFLDWCLTNLSIKNIEADLLGLSDLDKYNVGAANYRWAAVSIGVVSAVVACALAPHVNELEELSRVRVRDLKTRRAIGAIRPYMRCWATDYFTANAYFKLDAGMFDIVVLDNAHRVNLAWGLPLAYRGKRLVVIGDKNAARSSVFLDDLQLDSMARRYEFDRSNMLSRGLDYSDSSIYAAFSQA